MKKAWASPSTKTGFTIVELVVVIVVIAILAVVVSITYTKVQAGVRDSQRTSDIVRVKLAIEKYHADNSIYPTCPSSNACYLKFIADDLQPYLDSIPVDPSVTTAGTTGDYRYAHLNVSLDGYGISIQYENQTSCKTGKNMDPTWWSSAPTCTNF